MDCSSCMKILSSNGDFACGFLVFGCFSVGTTFCNVIKLLLICSFSLKVLQYGFFRFKGLNRFFCGFREILRILSSGVCSNFDFGDGLDSKCLYCKYSTVKLLNKSNTNAVDNKIIVNNESKEDGDSGDDYSEEKEDGDSGDDYSEEKEEMCNEDEMFDVLTLRKLVKAERQWKIAVCVELDKERMASASAAEEAMAMIMRIQSEKSSIEMASEQYRKMSEHKQLYDQEVISSLRWLVSKHESHRSLLEDQLRLCRQKLKIFMKNIDEQFEGFDPTLSFSNSIMDDNDVLISSLEMDLPL